MTTVLYPRSEVNVLRWNIISEERNFIEWIKAPERAPVIFKRKR